MNFENYLSFKIGILKSGRFYFYFKGTIKSQGIRSQIEFGNLSLLDKISKQSHEQ
jgi:hypothetical protein